MSSHTSFCYIRALDFFHQATLASSIYISFPYTCLMRLTYLVFYIIMEHTLCMCLFPVHSLSLSRHLKIVWMSKRPHLRIRVIMTWSHSRMLQAKPSSGIVWFFHPPAVEVNALREGSTYFDIARATDSKSHTLCSILEPQISFSQRL